jgi:hypothetical protein
MSFTPDEEARLGAGHVLTYVLEPARGGVAFRAAGIVESRPAQVWPALRDCEHYRDFVPRTLESALLARNGSEAVCYTRIDLPFPLADLVSELGVVESERSDGGFERRWRLVRGSYSHNVGSWTLLPHGPEGLRTLAIYQIEIDPDTLAPDFLVRRAQRASARDLFRALRERVREVVRAGPSTLP